MSSSTPLSVESQAVGIWQKLNRKATWCAHGARAKATSEAILMHQHACAGFSAQTCSNRHCTGDAIESDYRRLRPHSMNRLCPVLVTAPVIGFRTCGPGGSSDRSGDLTPHVWMALGGEQPDGGLVGSRHAAGPLARLPEPSVGIPPLHLLPSCPLSRTLGSGSVSRAHAVGCRYYPSQGRFVACFSAHCLVEPTRVWFPPWLRAHVSQRTLSEGGGDMSRGACPWVAGLVAQEEGTLCTTLTTQRLAWWCANRLSGRGC